MIKFSLPATLPIALAYFRPWTGSVKTMGFHKYSVTCVLLLGEEEMFMTTVGRSAIQSYVVVSAGKDAEVKIWWDGGSAINCLHIHPSPVKELKFFGGLVSDLGLGSTLLSSPNDGGFHTLF